MNFVVTFTDYMPPPRADGQPWTQILIFEAPAPGGTWTQIDSIAISSLPGGIDADPANPNSRTFTTDNATMQNGWYQVVFEDAAGHQMMFGPVQNVSYPWVPSLEQIGALLRTRTKDTAGNELGTFTTDTRPTAQDVQELIQQAVDTFVLRAGTEIPPELYQEAQRLIAIRTAMLVEISYFPEQIDTGRSPYNQYMQLWVEGYGDSKSKGVLIQAIESVKQGDTDILPTDPGIAVYNFPQASDIATRSW
jgi:hypothetical protein